MLDVTILLLLHRLGPQGAGDVPENDKVEDETSHPERDVQISVLGDEDVEVRIPLKAVIRISNAHVVQRLDNRRVIVMCMLRRFSVVTHPLPEWVLNLGQKKRNRKDGQRQNQIGQILEQAAHSDAPPGVRSIVKQHPKKATHHEGEAEEKREQPTVGECIGVLDEKED